MDLEEVKKQLYKEKTDFGKREEAPKEFEPGWGKKPLDGAAPVWSEEEKKIRQPFFTEQRKKILKFSAIGFTAVLVLVAAFIFWRSLSSFDPAGVSLTIFGPERVMSGEEVQYVIRYKNNTKISLENVKLTFIYSEDSVPQDKKNLTQIGSLSATILTLPNIEPGKSDQITLLANLIGLRDEKKKVTAKLTYRPANISSEFENSAEFTNTIFSVPLVLNFNLPDRVVNGQQLDVVLKYLNTADISFSNLVLKVDYPPGFDVSSSLPAADEGSNLWRLVEIGPQEEGKIVISGVLGGTKDEIKFFKATARLEEGETLKPVSEGLASTLVALSPLTVGLKVNEEREHLANVGEQLHYSVTFENTADVPINSAFINLKFDTKVLDFSSLKITRGFFNSIDNSITWNESSVPDLKTLLPQEQKKVDFYVNVKDKLPIANFSDKNFLINCSAKIDSANIPISLRGTQLAGTDSLSLKLNSKLIVSSKGYLKDDLFPASGPLPPVVGQETTYVISWQVINLSNDVQDVLVESYLPSYVRWLDKFDPNNEAVQYDQNSGKISWSLGKLAANAGILSPVKRLTFQIGLVPASNQVGNIVELVKSVMVKGKDIFTQASLTGSASQILSDLPDDDSVSYEQGKVQQ